MKTLLSNIATNPTEITAATLSIFGHHQSRQFVALAASELSSRDWEAKDKLIIAGSLATGMTTIFEMDGFQCGALHSSPLHLGAPVFETLLEEWSKSSEFDVKEKLSYDLFLAEIGYEAASSRIDAGLTELINATDLNHNKWEPDNTMSNAIRFLRKSGRYPTIEIIEAILKTNAPNACNQCHDLLASVGTGEALDILLVVYNSGKGGSRGSAFTAMERLAGRLGLLIVDVNGILEVKR